MDYSTLLPQIKSLHAQISKRRILLSLIQTLYQSNKALAYSYLTRLLWEYIAETLPQFLSIPEPISDKTFSVHWRKKRVTQELALAILNFHSITCEMDLSTLRTVLAIGAHACDLGYVFLNQIPHIQYIVTDSSCALKRAQNYFEKTFPEKTIFAYRPFQDFETVRSDFEKSAICMIEPNQLALLPARSIDLGITIDVLDKLSQQEISTYFTLLSSLIRDYFYFKGQKISAMKEADYQLPEEWEEVFWRTCELNPLLFEALFCETKTSL